MEIKRELLELMLAVAKENHPNEIVALITGRKGIGEELIFLPFESGETMAIIHTDMLPLGMKILGSFHSHPRPILEPSQADLSMFSRIGKFHIIVAYPYDKKSWRCFDRYGNEIEVKILD
ncbi:proteasome Rpn11 subunit JAMM motif, Metallo peptidase, MEROPS family M67B [Archaeoglobus sulfaticallidus PM70-1]|uniref:Proteasome Rpn11 subunit JAMM motif, Metallo peptidase, MEROPS family M67B n=1 Tax=Archaeoglobus sulfaticallidus PM70-1 TaxID=387631 RepID=N0BEK7_9EURY|nr:Mov34/MPN/PAD-1 family protein [Archaeoglobus sulfaticallidus]AGK60707.1 proteasome Rpn11 subunit JAMM motif, Metallo peptidase, MEROPS family M67B [Archaeoglobus sulfaticallidus PM70-1]